MWLRLQLHVWQAMKIIISLHNNVQIFSAISRKQKHRTNQAYY